MSAKPTEEQAYQERKRFQKSKKIMISQLISFVSQLKEGKTTYPKAINLLEKIRQDRII